MADEGDPELDVDLEPDLPVAEPEPEASDQPDAAEMAAGDEAATEPTAEPERQPTRGENRFQTLRNDNQRLNAELSETRRRLDELTRKVDQPTVRETPEARAARFALLTPQEQITETLRESEQRFSAQLSQVQMQNQESLDRTAFQAKCAANTLYAKWAPKVEGKLAELRARGGNAEREVVLKFLIGEAAIERASSKEGRREVQQATARVRAATTRPGNSGSDTQASRRTASSVERRLENVQI